MAHGCISFILTLLLVPAGLLAQDPPPNPTPENDQPGAVKVPFEDLPWQSKLGVRSALLTERIPLLDRVVLVPDLATWLDEISNWSMAARWPVLIEDDKYTPLFVRRFKPRRLVRRPSVGTDLPEDAGELKALARRTAVQAWGGDPENEEIEALYRRLSWVPPGIVATSYVDPAWPAALALAIGRGELLRTIEGNFPGPNGSLNAAELALLENTIKRMFAESGYSWNALGDELDALTLCRSIAVRTTAPLPLALRPDIPSAPRVGPQDPIALTDLLCRNPQGARWAICGWIWGDTNRSIYMAMCSLFLDRDSVLLVSAHGLEGDWSTYSIEAATTVLGQAEYEVVGVHTGMEANVDAWRRLVMSGPQADVFIFNTSGGESQLNLGEDTRGSSRDIPTLTRPVALHMIHSFSLHSPDDLSTIGARWLDRGVYAYVGSCDEPYLQAFIPPRVLVERIASFMPFLVAARMYNGPMALPWRVVTIGDPLMLMEPPQRRRRTRVDRPVEEADGAIELRAAVLDTLRKIMTSEGKVTDAEVFQDLYLLGQDELAAKLWEQMRENDIEGDLTPERARAVLPVHFARRDAGSFMAAYRLADEPAGDAREMLWTLWTPRLRYSRSPSEFALFERALRPGQMSADLTILLPGIEAALGETQQNAAVARAMERAESEDDRRRLKDLLN